MATIMKPFKVDRNGTEYYYDWTCPRCGGAGGSDALRWWLKDYHQNSLINFKIGVYI